MTMKPPRIFYVGMICTDAYVRATGKTGFIGAASGKMAAVVSALRLAGRRAVLVSLPQVDDRAGGQPARLCRTDGFPAIFLPFWQSKAANKVLSTAALAWFALRRVNRQDTVLFYNHAVEYLVALLILRMRGVAVFQDIEDMPTGADQGLRGWLNRVGYYLMFKLASPRKITVSNQIGAALNLQDFIAIQGVATTTIAQDATDKWGEFAAGAPLRVHYGGSLMASTGLTLFNSAIGSLDRLERSARNPITFVVTGVGDLSSIRALAAQLQSDLISIEVYQEVERRLYFELLDSCHASLSLKSPESAISSTTFPSKVIEITARGLALVATRVSDVDVIFSDNEAWLLPEFSEAALCAALEEMAQNPQEVRRRANAGQALAQASFAPLSVGHRLGSFLEAGPELQ